MIVTGASRGIGAQLYAQLTAQGKIVIGLARTTPEDPGRFVTTDLTKTAELPNILQNILQQCREKATSFTLINNAGTVEPIGRIGAVETDVIEQSTQLNLIAPMVLCNSFIEQLSTFEGPKKILNISSGAGRKVYEGWGVYCTTKAGLDHFSSVIYEEQKRQQYPVQIVSIAPGIIDTDMQAVIRESDAADFPLIDRFTTYKQEGALSSPAETAEKLIAFYQSSQFEKAGPLADIRALS